MILNTPAVWRTSSHCLGTGDPPDCVAVGDASGAVLVRDSKHPDMPPLALTREAFGALLDQIKEGP